MCHPFHNIVTVEREGGRGCTSSCHFHSCHPCHCRHCCYCCHCCYCHCCLIIVSGWMSGGGGGCAWGDGCTRMNTMFSSSQSEALSVLRLTIYRHCSSATTEWKVVWNLLITEVKGISRMEVQSSPVQSWRILRIWKISLVSVLPKKGKRLNWTSLSSTNCSCQLWSIVISPVASCPVCGKSKRPVVDWLQPVFLRTGCLAHDPPIQGHIPYFFHISIYLFEFTRVLSIMITLKMTYNAKSIISWAPVDQILWFLGK